VDPQFRNEIIEIYDDLISGGVRWTGHDFVVLKGDPDQRLNMIIDKLRELGGI